MKQNPQIYFKIGDGEEFNPADRITGLQYLGVGDDSSSPQFNNIYQDVEGRDGSPFRVQTFAKRTFNEKFFLHTTNWQDRQLAKHELYSMFGSRQAVRVRTDVNPEKVYFGYVTPFDMPLLEDYSHDSTFTIPFDVPNGVRYSRYRSDSTDMQYQFGMNARQGDKPQYHFVNQNNIRLYNASDIEINPYEQRHDLKIIVRFSGGSIKLTNTTTNTVWEFKKGSDGKDIVLDGINTYKDGKNANNDSNFGYLKLAPGWNNITVSGAGSSDIRFSFPFIYLI